MPTKAELEEQLEEAQATLETLVTEKESLLGQVEKLKEANLDLADELVEAESKIAGLTIELSEALSAAESATAEREALADQIAQKPPGRCINCGQDTHQIKHLPEGEGLPNGGYRCTLCKHEWTPEHEKAPFRKVQRGERL